MEAATMTATLAAPPTEATLAYRMLDGLREQRRKLQAELTKLAGKIAQVDVAIEAVERQIRETGGDHALSLESVCAVLEFDPDAIRDGLGRMLAAPSQGRRRQGQGVVRRANAGTMAGRRRTA
jgi:hypothetical protein